MAVGALRLAAAAIPLAAAMLGTTLPAAAEIVQKSGVRVSVKGQIAPTKLPRTGSAPVGVSMAGHITPTRPGALPKLETVSIAINAHGKIESHGIPLCRLGHIEPSTTAEALAACRSSLVGEGHFSAKVKLPEASPFPSEGKVLAFNGKLRGRPAIFAHIYGTQPVPTSYVLPFLIEKAHGTFGTVLRASLPKVTGEWGYVTGVRLDLQPRLLAAGCPAPAGFPAVVFPLLKASFGFSGGPSLSSILNRSCKVKG